jgi:hypothetical protein
MIQTISENRIQIFSAFDRKGSRIQRFREPERSDVNKALLKRYKQDRSDNIVPASGPLLMKTFVLPEFWFYINPFLEQTCMEI